MPLYLGSKTVSENINMGDTVIQNTFDLFDVKWSDHVINNESWMCADDFNWIDGSVFSAAWNELKSEWDLATIDSTPAQQDIIGNITINYWKSPKGYKLVEYGGDTPETNENLLQQLYDEVGIAWYYLIDTTGQIRFKLPRTKYGFVGVRSGAGNFVDESLPNIKGAFNSRHAGTSQQSGAFASNTSISEQNYTSGIGTVPMYGTDFDASRSSPAYQDGANVQQKSTEMHLYFYLADFVRTPLESNLNTFITETKETLNEKVNVSDYNADKTLIENDINTLETTKITQTDLDNTINTQRTNCITAIPQDIKLELSNGTLTLKAGSKIYVPNGVGVFDEVVIASDLTHTTTANDVLMLVATKSNLSPFYVSRCFSGSTAPTTSSSGYLWYDTTNNKLKVFNGTTWNERGDSLPIAIVTANGTSYSSIDQVFNGFGYIGSTVFALPGVEGLIPNGRNADGSLNNTKFITNSVLTEAVVGTYSGYIVMASSIIGGWSFSTGEYDFENNINKYNDTKNNVSIVGTLSTENGRVTSFNPKTTFQVADYYDFKQLDENIVHKTGDEEIFDLKKFKGASPIHIDRNGNTQTEIMAENNGTRTGGFRNYDNGANTTSMYVVDGSNAIVGQIFVAYDGSKVFTQAPTPPTSSNDMNIATTNWVSDPAKSTNVVHRNDNESINGVKTFLKRLTSIAPNIDTNVTPSSNIYNDFMVTMDKTANNQIGYFGNAQLSNGDIVSRVGTSRKKEDGSYIHTEIQIGTKADGTIFTLVPTPSVDSDVRNIVNINWINQKFQVVSTLPASPNANVFYFVTNA